MPAVNRKIRAERDWIVFILLMIAAGCVLLSLIPDSIWAMLAIQFLALLLVLVAAGEVYSARKDWLKQRQASGQCLACGYDLTANVGEICPECGKARELKVI